MTIAGEISALTNPFRGPRAKSVRNEYGILESNIKAFKRIRLRRIYVQDIINWRKGVPWA